MVESWDIRVRERQLNVQLQKALVSIESANHAKTRVLSAASHDLRQPLHTLTTLGAALELRKLDPRSHSIVTLLNGRVAVIFSAARWLAGYFQAGCGCCHG